MQNPDLRFCKCVIGFIFAFKNKTLIFEYFIDFTFYTVSFKVQNTDTGNNKFDVK